MIVVALIAVAYFARRNMAIRRGESEDLENIYSQHMQAFVVTSYLVLPSVLNLLFKGFDCEQKGYAKDQWCAKRPLKC